MGERLTYSFVATKGLLSRVTIAWWSEADPPPEYPDLGDDILATDFDLIVVSPDPDIYWSSSSQYNNYEIVEFIAPESGIYSLEVLKYSASESDNQIGIAYYSRSMPYGLYLPVVIKGQ